jgi:DNA polymerase III delta subunit
VFVEAQAILSAVYLDNEDSYVTPSFLSSAVTVLHGSDRLAIRERIDAIRQQIDPSGLSTSIFDPASGQIPEIASAAGSPGFFGAERLVFCFGLITPSGRRRSKKAANDDSLAFLGRVAPGVRVVIVEEHLGSADERRLRVAASDIEVVVMEVPRGRALIDWVCERVRQHEAMIDGAVATQLIEALFPGTWRQKSNRDDVPPDLFRLDAELTKLAVSAGGAGEITGQMVSELVPNADALDIWGLSNAIADRDRQRALRQVELALDSGQAPEVILAQIAAQFETLAVLVVARGQSTGAVSAKTGLSEGRLRQAGRSARNYTRSELAMAIKEIRRVDFGTKQGHFEPDDALVGLVSILAGRR